MSEETKQVCPKCGSTLPVAYDLRTFRFEFPISFRKQRSRLK
jgi:hypothetical protein